MRCHPSQRNRTMCEAALPLVNLCLRGRSVARIRGSAARISALCSQRRGISTCGLALFSRRNRRATLRGWEDCSAERNTPASRHTGRANLRVRVFCCVCLLFALVCLIFYVACSTATCAQRSNKDQGQDQEEEEEEEEEANEEENAEKRKENDQCFSTRKL